MLPNLLPVQQTKTLPATRHKYLFNLNEAKFTALSTAARHHDARDSAKIIAIPRHQPNYLQNALTSAPAVTSEQLLLQFLSIIRQSLYTRDLAPKAYSSLHEFSHLASCMRLASNLCHYYTTQWSQRPHQEHHEHHPTTHDSSELLACLQDYIRTERRSAAPSASSASQAGPSPLPRISPASFHSYQHFYSEFLWNHYKVSYCFQTSFSSPSFTKKPVLNPLIVSPFPSLPVYSTRYSKEHLLQFFSNLNFLSTMDSLVQFSTNMLKFVSSRYVKQHMQLLIIHYRLKLWKRTRMTQFITQIRSSLSRASFRNKQNSPNNIQHILQKHDEHLTKITTLLLSMATCSQSLPPSMKQEYNVRLAKHCVCFSLHDAWTSVLRCIHQCSLKYLSSSDVQSMLCASMGYMRVAQERKCLQTLFPDCFEWNQFYVLGQPEALDIGRLLKWADSTLNGQHKQGIAQRKLVSLFERSHSVRESLHSTRKNAAGCNQRYRYSAHALVLFFAQISVSQWHNLLPAHVQHYSLQKLYHIFLCIMHHTMDPFTQFLKKKLAPSESQPQAALFEKRLVSEVSPRDLYFCFELYLQSLPVEKNVNLSRLLWIELLKDRLKSMDRSEDLLSKTIASEMKRRSTLMTGKWNETVSARDEECEPLHVELSAMVHKRQQQRQFFQGLVD